MKSSDRVVRDEPERGGANVHIGLSRLRSFAGLPERCAFVDLNEEYELARRDAFDQAPEIPARDEQKITTDIQIDHVYRWCITAVRLPDREDRIPRGDEPPGRMQAQPQAVLLFVGNARKASQIERATPAWKTS